MKWLEKNTESASQQYLDMLTDREAVSIDSTLFPFRVVCV